MLDLNIHIYYGKLNTKIHDKRDNFFFPVVNHPFLNGDVPLAQFYGVYISQLANLLIFVKMFWILMKGIFI